MNYNPIYAELIKALGQDQVNAIPRYSSKDAATAVAKNLRAERKEAGLSRTGEEKAKVYYFNKATHRVAGKPKAGESHPEAFATETEAKMWGYTHRTDSKGNVVVAEPGTGYIKKKPVENPKGKLGTRAGDKNIRYIMKTKVINGRETNVFTEWTNSKGEATKHQEAYRDALREAKVAFKAPRLYTVDQRLAMSNAKSESAKAKNSSTKTKADLDEAVRQARARGVKKESIDKTVGDESRSFGQRVATLNLIGRGGSGGPGVYMTKRNVVNGVSTKAPGARANRMWDGEGNLKPRAREFVTWYRSATGKTGKAASDLTDAEVIAILNKAAAQGWLAREERV
jgi:hypothetical protein